MKILICDDEIEIVNALKKYLTSKGCDVGYALDGKEGLELIKSGDYGIVFLNINMPEFTGFEVLRYVKDNNIKTKVIFLTGYPCVDGNFCKRLRVDEYLEKPVDLKVVGEIVDKYASL
jgi:DNA-binding response OmpR family regulator